MKKRLRFGLVIGAVVVVLAIAGFAGGRHLIGAASTLPGDNCTAGAAVVSVTIESGKITSSLASFSPQICYSFAVTNNDKQAYDFLIEDPGSNTVLAAITNIAAGQTGSVAYSFAPATSQTPVNFVYTATGSQTPLGTQQLFLSQ